MVLIRAKRMDNSSHRPCTTTHVHRRSTFTLGQVRQGAATRASRHRISIAMTSFSCNDQAQQQ
jgi:hypothetical protein